MVTDDGKSRGTSSTSIHSHLQRLEYAYKIISTYGLCLYPKISIAIDVSYVTSDEKKASYDSTF